MKVDKIKSSLSDYGLAIKNGHHPVLVDVLDACAVQFAEHWETGAEDFAQMYDQSLTSNVSRRLWTGVDYFPKEAILTFCDEDPDFVMESRNILRH